MKQINFLSILTLLFISTISCRNIEKSNITLLSNQIPEDTPLVFGPDIISTDDAMDFAITFNPEMDEMYFTRRKPEEQNKVYAMKLIDGKWTAPEVAFFSANKGWDFEPHITPKGDILYFGSTRPLNDTIESSGMHQWYVKKNGSGWSQPIPLEKPFVDRFVMYLSSSENNTLYFTSKEKEEKLSDGGIYYASSQEGQDVSIKKMGKEINSGAWISHSYIAPDESYMIFDAERPSGFGECDLYISFKENGVWTESYNLGSKINTEMCEMTASVSPDGKYLFFHRGGEDIGNIYWVDFIQVKKELLENINSN
jgi:hypothetical protein